jgi:hypothetical protein
MVDITIDHRLSTEKHSVSPLRIIYGLQLIVDRQLVDELTVCLGWCRLDRRFTSFTVNRRQVNSEQSAWAGTDGRRSTVINGRWSIWASQQIGHVPFDNCTTNHVKPGDNSNGRNSAHNTGVNFSQDSHAVSSSSTGGTDTGSTSHTNTSSRTDISETSGINTGSISRTNTGSTPETSSGIDTRSGASDTSSHCGCSLHTKAMTW